MPSLCKEVSRVLEEMFVVRARNPNTGPLPRLGILAPRRQRRATGPHVTVPSRTRSVASPCSLVSPHPMVQMWRLRSESI